MVLDFVESIVELVAILGALLISLFGFINTNSRRWLYCVIFYVANLLSAYFWASYVIIMRETPEVYDFFAYFGWNVSYFVLLLLLIHIKSREELRFFHPLMLIPIPLDIAQFFLYIRYGGILNNLYQVGVGIALTVLCIQSLLWYRREKKNGAEPPYIAFCILLYTISEFGMWTASSLPDPDSSLYYLYYPWSFLLSSTLLLLTWAVSQSLKYSYGNKVYINKNLRSILKISYATIAAAGSLGGIFLGVWIRNVLIEGISDNNISHVFNIITVILFLISTIIAAATGFIVNIVYFVQKTGENETLKKERQVAEHSNEAKSEFLAQMSHEIRTPMNAVLGMNEMILHVSTKSKNSLPGTTDEIKERFSDIAGYSANINSAGNNLLAIINDILDISKIEAGKIEIREGRYTLSSILNSMNSIMSSRAAEKGLEFRIDADESIPDVLYGDEIRIRQVITNVLNNAVKYTREGSVTLSVYAEGPRNPLAGETVDLVFCIRDTGIGIKEEDLGRLFGRFERVDMDKNSTIEGTGLGLAITRRLLVLMNGDISVTSVYGEGSEFTIKLPQKIVSDEPVGDFRKKAFDTADGESDADINFTAPGARILIVDDTRLNLIVAMGLLKETGIRTDLSGSGKGALNMMSRVKYDLVLLDQRMPEMDGIETLKHIREGEEGSGSRIPVICLTADAVEGARQRYLDEGFDDYLTKPIDGKALKMMVRRYLPPEKIES